ncbi:glycosyltransferase family 2 protein, partial [bacterium]|nr:glycosyltransferase family 2 protein [bacterium]
MKKKISVIIPAFNRANLLKKAIESVLSQTYQGFELIIVDDGSTDNTYEIVSEFKNDIIYIKQENRGAAAARNTGIKRAENKFLAFLDSDDCWDKEKLAIQIDEMQKNPSYLVSHTQETWYRNGVLLNQKKKHK